MSTVYSPHHLIVSVAVGVALVVTPLSPGLPPALVVGIALYAHLLTDLAWDAARVERVVSREG